MNYCSSGSSSAAPLGLIFSTFMVAIMIGSSLFSHALEARGLKPEDTLHASAAVFAACTFVCTMVAGPNAADWQRYVAFVAFIVLEAAIGLYFPSIGKWYTYSLCIRH
jgi:uncharacterized membrane protein